MPVQGRLLHTKAVEQLAMTVPPPATKAKSLYFYNLGLKKGISREAWPVSSCYRRAEIGRGCDILAKMT